MNFGIQNDQPTSSSAQVYDLVQILRERMTSYSQRGGGYDGIKETVGMCTNRPNNKKDIAYKISQRAIASIPTASVSTYHNSRFPLLYHKSPKQHALRKNVVLSLFVRYFQMDSQKTSLF